jgi:hypothetical protein
MSTSSIADAAVQPTRRKTRRVRLFADWPTDVIAVMMLLSQNVAQRMAL